ncbi:MAG: SUF system NifU family Fe-S cluster assembly protein [Acidiphilium sp. 37-64-53]|uniref:Fe-S cluster assembly sulfur transfer protein SufU n=1 Tax=Acidiphilium TaxID=522 RepID=UPI000BC3A1F1|nr:MULTISPECIES: SUF system NifU family Fe-S cluster assembly protein [Acidiphilium]OYW04006.1 MAG: SUF system NifU family Fe-S cluster assembly protein [Acidiphilium sp. 37-64-53]OZB29066.1 MAG: SUF system NifU family Fe-S cluster assembly protein [Acidiphilium sp. 34-64-41]HQT83234.1 SUF system NifU family Fe-S cluster assembly protein [Acidiphilium rubrum]
MSETDDLYQALIMERARSPHHTGGVDSFDAEAEGDNPMCGDRVRIRISYDHGLVGDLRHETRGCAICVSSADLMGDAVIGKSGPEIDELAEAFDAMVIDGRVPDRSDFANLRALAGVHAYRSRHRCAILPWQALRAALGRTMEYQNG